MLTLSLDTEHKTVMGLLNLFASGSLRSVFGETRGAKLRHPVLKQYWSQRLKVRDESIIDAHVSGLLNLHTLNVFGRKGRDLGHA